MDRKTLGETPSELGIDGVTAGADGDWDPALAETVVRSLARWVDLGSPDLDAELGKLEVVHGEALYSELIYLLSHLRFTGARAKEYWQEIATLRSHMQDRLASFVDVRVALASYFLHVNRKLENPKIIELKLFERTRAFAYRDDLTGLYNHRFFNESLVQEVLRAERFNQPLSLVMVDVDDFKAYNDRNGHESGNEVLTLVAGILTSTLRKEDSIARYGGEEFALILPATPKVGARLVAEKTRTAIEMHDFPRAFTQPLGRLTVSMGIATFPGDATEPGELIRSADRALYAAKDAGKNRVQLYGHSRRSFHRVLTALEGRYRSVSREFRPLVTVNVSEGGVLFVTDQHLPVDALVELHLALPDGREQVRASGRVVHVLERGDNVFETAVRIVSIDTRDRLAMSRYVHEARERAADEDDAQG